MPPVKMTLSTAGPTRSMLVSDVVAGDAIAQDDHFGIWFIDVLGGLKSLHWQLVTLLPQPVTCAPSAEVGR